MQDVAKTAEAQRRFPNWLIWMFIAMFIALWIGSMANVFPWQGVGTPAVQPDQQTTIGPANPQVPQNVQKNVAATAPVVMEYQVTWTEVKGFDPSTIPVEEGFYSGEWQQPRSVALNDPMDIPVGDAFAWKILPHLQEVGRGNQVATVRDQVNKDIVLVSIEPVARYQPYLLLSVDGQKSWYMLNTLPVYWGGYQQGGVGDPRVVARGEEIHLYGEDARSGYHWWEAVVIKNKLPRS